MQTGSRSRRRDDDDDPSGKNKRRGAPVCLRVLYLIAALVVLTLVMSALTGDMPQSPAHLLKTVRNSLKQFVIRRPDTPPADSTAASLLFATYATSALHLSASELSDALQSAALTSPPGKERGGQGAGWKAEAAAVEASALVHALGDVVEPRMGDDDVSSLPNDVASLYLLALYKHWEDVREEDKTGKVEQAARIGDHIVGRITQEGLLDVRSSSSIAGVPPSSPPPLAVRTLRQAQAVAGLRCLGATIEATVKVNRLRAKHAGRHYYKEQGGKGRLLLARGTAASWLQADPYFAAAEHLRRGLPLLTPASSMDDAVAPVLIGMRYEGEGVGEAGVLDPSLLIPVPGLSSDLPSLLSYLEPGDISSSLVRAIAASSLRLSTPLGLRTGVGAVAAGEGEWRTGGAAWRVDIGAHAAILGGVAKHLLASVAGDRQEEGGSEEEDEGAWVTADALAALLDRVLRLSPALSSLQKEAAGRNDEAAGEAAARVQRVLDRQEEGGASSPPPLSPSSMLSSVHRFPYPDSLIPLKGEDSPLDPRTAPPMLPVWSWLQGTSGLTGTLFRLQYLGAMVRGGARLDVKMKGRGKGGKEEEAAAKALAAQLLDSLAYPPSCLQVVRLPPPAVGGEGKTQGARAAEAQAEETARSGLAALGLSHDRSVGLEHVVIPVPAHAHDAAPDAPVGGGEEEARGVLFVRGDGHPVSLPTVIAARMYRLLYEAAYAWHKARQEAQADSVSPPLGRVEEGAAGLASRGKAALRAVAGKLRAVKLASVLFPFKTRPTRAGPAPSLTNGAVLSFLTSGAPQAAALLLPSYWVDSATAAKWRSRTGVEGGARGAQPVAQPRPLPHTSHGEEEEEAPALPNALPEPVGDGEARALDESVGEVGASSEDSEDEGEAVDPALLYARLCSVEAGYGTSDPPPPWYSSCCEPHLGLDGTLATLAASGQPVGMHQVPTFQCVTARPSLPGQPLGRPAPVSCAWMEDEYCDCAGDAGDENSTSACAASDGAFKCASGVRTVLNGELHVKGGTSDPLPSVPATLPRSALARHGYIPADKVGDGVWDCVQGEDEASP